MNQEDDLWISLQLYLDFVTYYYYPQYIQYDEIKTYLDLSTNTICKTYKSENPDATDRMIQSQTLSRTLLFIILLSNKFNNPNNSNNPTDSHNPIDITDFD